MSKATINVETDWDFGIVYKGERYTDSEFNIVLDDIGDLMQVQVLGPFGAPSGGKTWEWDEAVKAIVANPDEEFCNQGGNRGVHYFPAK